MSKYILEFKNIAKSFPGVKALQNVSFGINKGSVHAIMGGNGAGKSTLINIISGVFGYDSGTLLLDGKPVNFQSPKEAKEYGISTIFQELNVIPDLDVKSNLFIGREMTNKAGFLDKRAMYKKANEIINHLGLNMNVNDFVRTMSVAQCKMVEIGRELYGQASILIMDEPTASISDHEVTKLLHFIKELKNKGTTIIYISHKIEEIYRVCDHITVLRDGMHILTKPIEEVPSNELISAMMNNAHFKDAYPVRNGKPQSEIMLEVQHLSFKNKVKDVSFKVKKGEIFGIAGIVGAGRTELMKTIIGDLKKDSGKVVFKGEIISPSSPVKSVKKGIAYLPEDRKREGLFLDQSYYLNTVISCLNHVSNGWFVSMKQIKALCSESIRKLRVSVVSMETLVGTLSGGNQQKVVISKWLSADTDLFIFDEPTVGIDIGAKYEIRKLINQLADEGKSIIVISSEIDEVCNMVDRLIVLKEGQVVKELEKSEINRERVYEYAAGV